MRSLSSVGLALSLVFGCLLLALVAELYYLLWWKKKITNKEIGNDYRSPSREFLYFFCWKKPSLLSSTALNPQELSSDTNHAPEPQALVHSYSSKDFWAKPFGEEGEDTELMGPENLCGPPRFLFTIKEETKEDLESEDAKSRGDKSGKGSRNRSLSDMLLTVETPFLTPIASPSCFTPPLTPLGSSPNYHGFDPLFESTSDAEFNRIRSSPPPKFQFLKDAEDKHYRRKLTEEARKEVHKIDGSKDEEDGSFITINIDSKNEEIELNHPDHNVKQYNSSSSVQVLPLTYSPSTFRPPINKKPQFSY